MFEGEDLMGWRSWRAGKEDLPQELALIQKGLVRVGPWAVLLLLAEAMPATGPGSLPSPFDFAGGFLVGVGLAGLWLGGLEAIRPGFLGWVRAFAMGLTVATFLMGTGDFFRGFHGGMTNRSPASVPATWAGFATFLLVSLTLMGLIRRMALHQAEAHRQRAVAEEARQQALRARLAPHFIFNTLNTLHAQIEVDPRGAQATTERLAQLFRQVVEVAEQPTIPLKQELAFVEAYLGLEQARLGDRLKVAIEIPEDLEMVEVPPLSLQILVENAVKHGVAPLEQGGTVRIGAERADGVLRIWVEDPGTGVSPLKGTGTALEILRQRLEKPEDLTVAQVNGRHRVGFRWVRTL